MHAILKKTVGPNFQAGDVVKGDSARIERLVNQGLAVRDNSRGTITAAIFSTVLSGLIIGFMIFMLIGSIFAYLDLDFFNSPTGILGFEMPMYWAVMLIITNLVSIGFNIAYIFNKKLPYSTYNMAIASNLIGGIWLHIEHEKNARVYQPKGVSVSAAISQYFLGALAMGMVIFGVINHNTEMFTYDNWSQQMQEFVDQWGFLALYLVVFFLGMGVGLMFDHYYKATRNRYITFLRRTNAKVEYKTKALNLMKAYERTGNSDTFMEKNIELLEALLDVTRHNLEDDE